MLYGSTRLSGVAECDTPEDIWAKEFVERSAGPA